MIPLDQYSTHLKETFEKLRDSLHNRAEDLFKGKAENGEYLLVKALESGSWIPATMDNEAFRDRRENMKKLLEASMINHAWRSEFVIVTRSRAKGDSCFGDDRGHPALKVCLEDEYPGEVFYVV